MFNDKITGKQLSEKVTQSLKEGISPAHYPPLDFSKKKRSPCLHIVMVGNNPSSLIYVQRKMATAKLCGIEAHLHHYDSNCGQDQLIQTLETLSEDPLIDAILLQLPLPPHLDPQACIDTIAPEKDVDGLSSQQIGRLATDPSNATIACTPLGIWALLKALGLQLKGQEVVIVGRSRIVGRPLELLLSSQLADANVTCLHSKSAHLLPLEHWTKRADILILAAGKKAFFHQDHIKEGAIVIDVGIHPKIENGRTTGITGDANYQSLQDKASYISSVPGGVGPMTVASLMYNCWKLALR